jgi:ABC-type dipeptide/oligopeptide/nickel transport system permease subunit
MKALRVVAWAVLAFTACAALCANFIAPAPYEQQFRDFPNARPSPQFPLGTDELGRDRLSRLLYGTRISLLLAPAAALLAALIAAFAGITAGMAGGRIEQAILACVDLVASLPWLFLLIAVRAVLPLNVSAYTSVGVTFLLLGALGWASGTRVIRSAVRSVKESGFMVEARSLGVSRTRLFLVQLLPNLKGPIAAQFWLSIPLFLLAEANLGVLGLGVSEPLPSWGNLLLDLVNHREIAEAPWRLAPAILLVLVLLALQVVQNPGGTLTFRRRAVAEA